MFMNADPVAGDTQTPGHGPKYAPANADGEKPYVVWKGWTGGASEVRYGVSLRAALEKAYGSKGAKAANGRRATPGDVAGWSASGSSE